MRAGRARYARHPSLFRSVYLPRSADGAAFAMTTYGIPLIVVATTRSATLTGVAFALEWLPRLVAFTVAGSLVDRHGVSRIFRTACVGRALAVLLAALLLAAPDVGVPAAVTVMALAPVSGFLTECSYIAVETAGGEASRTAGQPDRGRTGCSLSCWGSTRPPCWPALSFPACC